MSFSTNVRRLMVAALLCVFCIPQSVFADQAGDDYKLARGHFDRKRWPFAEEAFQKFLVDHPNHKLNPLGRFYLGLVRVYLKKYVQARMTLEDFARKYPNSTEVPHASYRIGECSYHLKEFSRAERELSAFVAKHKKTAFSESAWAYLGDAQRQRKNYQGAIRSLKNSLALAPKGSTPDETWFSLAESYVAINDVDEALKIFRQISSNKTSPRAPSAQMQIGAVFFGQKKYREAAAEYVLIGSRFSDSKYASVAKLNAGFSYYQLGEFGKALAQFDAAEAEPSQAITAGYWKGLSLKSLRDYSSAADVLAVIAKKIKKDDPLEESIVYQQADCEFKAGKFDTAANTFLTVTRRWPKGQFADESLYFATECILDAATKLGVVEKTEKLAEAELLLDKFDREYKTSKLTNSHHIQRGHFLVLRGAPEDLDRAEELFQSVLKVSGEAQTQGEARYELARLLQSRGNHSAAATILKPLAESVIKNGQTTIPEILILYPHLLIQTKEYKAAQVAAQAYLTYFKKGANRDQAWGMLASSSALDQSWKSASDAVSTLVNDHSDSPIVARTTERVAEIAWDAKQYNECVRYFTILVKTGTESPYHAKALSGLGWSEYHLKNFEKAEEHYAQFLKDHPTHKSGANCAFQIGDCRQQRGKIDEAAEAFASAFEKFKGYDAMMAGVQAARIHSKRNRTAAADKLYAAVADAYPMDKQHAGILSEWALVLAEADQYDQSDAVYRRLVKEHPESTYTDNARYNLADSDLINGKTKEARAEFLLLVDDKKSDDVVVEDSLHRLVLIAQAQQDWKSLVAHAGSMSKKFPKGEYAHEVSFQLGNAQVMMGDHKAAEVTLSGMTGIADRAAQAAPWFDHIWTLLAESQVQQKKYKSVLQTAADFLKQRPESKLHYQMDEIVGRSWKRQAKFDEARLAFKRAINSEHGARTATAAKAQLMLAETYFIQKNYKSALNEYTRLVSVFDLPAWQAPALLQEGKCFELLGDKPEAAKSYNELIKKHPQTEFAAQAKARLKKLGA
jgi:cellulose synthase operon protein C